MSSVPPTPLLGNKILVPGCYSHKEDDEPADEYYTLVDINNPGDGMCYSVTRLVGGKYGRLSTDDGDTLELCLEEFSLFRGFFMRSAYISND